MANEGEAENPSARKVAGWEVEAAVEVVACEAMVRTCGTGPVAVPLGPVAGVKLPIELAVDAPPPSSPALPDVPFSLLPYAFSPPLFVLQKHTPGEA